MSGVLRLARPEALRGLRLDRPMVIDASAGTGKTFTLEHLVVELLLGGATIDQILVVTFTEKATAELRVRVRSKLEALLSSAAPQDALATSAGEALVIDDAARARLERALHGYDGATIATIHAFCQRVLRENAFASGRLFEEVQVDGRDVFARVLRDVLRRDIATDPARARWLEAALADGWSMARLEDLLFRCLSARCELLPAFGDEEGKTLDTALASLDTADLRSATAMVEIQRWGTKAQTARAVAGRLRSLADAVDRVREARSGAPGFVLAARKFDLAYLRTAVPRAPGGGGFGRAVSTAVALARITPSLPAAVVQTMLAPVREELARRKREAGQFDFDDMLLLVEAALRGPRGEALRSSMRERWPFALIDEFQDTDETQWSIFRRAFFEPGAGRTLLFLVGDPKQSIYRFRGADVDTYLRARTEVLDGGGVSVPLLRNYRSTREVVEATNALFDARARPPFFTGPVVYEPVACGRPERTLVDGRGLPVTAVHSFQFDRAIDLPRLAARIAGEILDITNPSRPWRLDGRPLAPSDVFVLTRKNDEARAVGAALREAGVPFAYYKEDGLFQSDEALDIRTLLAAIDAPTDRSRRASAWLTRFFGLPLEEVDRARDLPATHSLVVRLAEWKALGEARDFDRLFESILSGSGVIRREIFFGDSERELTNTLHIFEVLLEYSRQTRVTLTDLVHLISGLIAKTRLPIDMEGNLQRLESERRAVQVMTVHKAKGLEAPVVFLAGGFSSSRGDEPRVFHEGGRRCAWIGPPPSDVKERASEEEREDEQRLMYVALTRTIGRLYLPSAIADGAPAKVRGAYDGVHRRLCSLLDARDALFSAESVPSVSRLKRSPVPANDVGPSPPAPASPPVELLVAGEDRDYDALREAHAGAITTSYTRMRLGRGRARPSGSSVREVTRDRPELRDTKALEEAQAVAPEAPLRSARASGVFVHELLERIPLMSFESAGFEEWRGRPDVSVLMDESLSIHRVHPAQRAHAERLVWSAYTTTIDLPGGARVRRLVDAAPIVREMDFLFMIPGQRVFARGSLDVAFEHEGLTYFADWKTDSRAEYDSAALARHVEEHYGEQVKLYALAILKLLDVEDRGSYEARFGGLLYLFLRGMDASGAGVWSMRPTWDEIVAFGEWLREQGAEMTGRRR